MRNSWDNKKTEDLIEAILTLKNKKQAKAFLRDLLTEKELIEFGNRWRAVNMLEDNISYKNIAKETGLSSRTIARISKWLNNGQGGYKLILSKINHHHNLSLFRKRLS